MTSYSMISPHISYKEATKSAQALRLGINNTPSPVHVANMILVANACFEPLRRFHGKPIHISSFFRSGTLNALTPGASKTSQHLCGLYSGHKEAAIDIDMDVFDNGMTNAEAFLWLANNVEFDQLIWEFGTDKNPAWVHISYSEGRNRYQILKSSKTPFSDVIYKTLNIKDLNGQDIDRSFIV